MDVRVFRCRRVYLPTQDREVGVLTEIVSAGGQYRELSAIGRDYDWGANSPGARALAVSILARISPATAEAQATRFVLDVLSQIGDRVWQLDAGAIDRWCRSQCDGQAVLREVLVIPETPSNTHHVAAVERAIDQQARRRQAASLGSPN